MFLLGTNQEVRLKGESSLNLRMNWRAKLEVQDIKIAIAVGICLFASMFINIINVLPAGISAILCMPVSYTHLDVYKRQALQSFGLQWCLLWWQF